MKKYINILCVLDRSGSMYNIIGDAISGFNFFLNEQKKIKGDANMSTMLFDTEFKVSELIPIKKVKKFNTKTYSPRGGTALYDAIGKTIDTELDRLSTLPKEERPSKTIIVVLSDGGENSSREYHQDLIKRMINEMREEFNWEFIFLAANQDVMFTADGLGISKGNSMNFDATGEGINVAYQNINNAISYYRTTNEKNYDNIFEKI